MADRTSAGIFGELFSMLAEDPTEQHKEDVGDELIKLGLAKMGIDPDYPEDGETIIYKGDEGWD